MRVFAHTINHICFGEDFNDDKFVIQYYDKRSDTFTEKKVSMREAMHNMAVQIIETYSKQMAHPISGIAKVLF